MKRNIQHKWFDRVKLILPVFFIAYILNVSLFLHTHIVNGVTIVHSHPWSDANHHHSSAQFQLIHLLSHFDSDGDITFDYSLVPTYHFVRSLHNFISVAVPTITVHFNELRGPPSFFIL